jgi:hypothetical protein
MGAGFSAAQTIDPRVVAAFGPQCNFVRETAIAPGEHKAIALYIGSAQPGWQVGYGVYDIASGAWTEALLPSAGFASVYDPSIAYDPTTCNFVLAAIGRNPDGRQETHIVISRYEAEDCITGDGSFSPWRSLYGSSVDFLIDKPWIVAGEITDGNQEFYITYIRTPQYPAPDGWAYRRSTDGGQTWNGGDIMVGINRVLGSAHFGVAQPTVANDGPLYVAYMYNNNTIRFLSGARTSPTTW